MYSSAAQLLAATVFPADHNFGSLQGIGREELEAIVQITKMPLRDADQKLRASLCINTELVWVMRRVLNSDVQTSLGWDKSSEVFPSRRAAKQELLKMGPAATYLPETTSKGGCSSSCSSGSSCSSDSDGSGSLTKSAPEPDNGC